jgi:hypothetical protein
VAGLCISLATRGRPQKLLDTIKRDLSCLSRDDSVLMVLVDADDEETIAVANLKHRQLKWNILPREDTIAAKWNRALGIDAKVYMIKGDDDPLSTSNTDEKILHAASLFPEGIGCVYGHLANASFPGIMCVTKKWTDLLGFIMPEFFPYWFCDHWVDDVARLTGRISFADVKTDQSNIGKTQELREPAWWATWFDACYLIRRKQALKIIEAIDELPIKKEILRNHYPLIEYRSKWINQNVRDNARNLEHWSGAKSSDERYQRVKDKATAMLPDILSELPEQEARVYRELLTPPTSVTNLRRAFG